MAHLISIYFVIQEKWLHKRYNNAFKFVDIFHEDRGSMNIDSRKSREFYSLHNQTKNLKKINSSESVICRVFENI